MYRCARVTDYRARKRQGTFVSRARLNIESAAFRRNNTPGNYPSYYSKLVGSSFAREPHATRDPLASVYTYGPRGGPGRTRCDRIHLLKEENRSWPLHVRNMPEVIVRIPERVVGRHYARKSFKLLERKRR